MHYRRLAEARALLENAGYTVTAPPASVSPEAATMSPLEGAQRLCHTNNVGTHIGQLNEDIYVVPSLTEIKAFIGAEALTEALAGGRLECPYATVCRESISEDELTCRSTTEPKLLVGGDALSYIRVAAAVKKALTTKGLSARIATNDESEIIGPKLRIKGVQIQKSYYGWFPTLDSNGLPVTDLDTILATGKLPDGVRFFSFVFGHRLEMINPRFRYGYGGLVLVVSKVKR